MPEYVQLFGFGEWCCVLMALVVIVGTLIGLIVAIKCAIGGDIY